MHEFLSKLSEQELASVCGSVDLGLAEIREYLNTTEKKDYYDKFIEEASELILFLFMHFDPNKK